MASYAERITRVLRGRRVPWRSRYVRDRLTVAAKGTLAAGLAWGVGRYALAQSESVAYWAPLSAVFVMSAFVARSVQEGARYLLGFFLGVGVGMTVGLLLGPNWYGILVVVFASLLLASWSRLGQQGVQVPFVGLFVLLFGGNTPLDFVPPRLAEVGVGATIGVFVNVAVLPPLHLRPAEYATRRLRDGVTALLTDMATELGEHWPPEDGPDLARRASDLDPLVSTARAATREAAESTRYNPRSRRWGRPYRTEEAVDRLEVVVEAVAGIARTLARAGEADGRLRLGGRFRTSYAELLNDTAAMVDSYAIPVRRDPDPDEVNETLDKVWSLQRDGGHEAGAYGSAWFAEGHLLVEVERILGELIFARASERR